MSCPYLAKKDGDWYCTEKGGYVSYDSYCSYNYDSCTYYNNGNSGGCFLTTACVTYKGLPDDCYELNTLRNFRDNYLLTFESGKADVEEYYKIAPDVVDLIFESSYADDIFSDIYNMILKCINYIENGKNDDAHKCYKEFVKNLKTKLE